MKERILLSKKDLIAEIERRLASHSDTKYCDIVGNIRALENPYEDGGNWARNIALKLSSADGSDPEKCANTAAEIIETLAEEVNLKTD